MPAQSLLKDTDPSELAVVSYLQRLWGQPALTSYSLIESSTYRPRKTPIAEGVQASVYAAFSKLSVSHSPMMDGEPKKNLRNLPLIRQLILELEDLHRYLTAPVSP